MVRFLQKHREILLYLLFGGLTTLVNIAVYAVCAGWLRWGTAASTIIAWFLSVVFAFITNKLFVFESRSRSLRKLIFEMGSFFSCRLLSGLLDLFVMWLTVDVWQWNDLLMKIISNIFVIIINYLFSKIIIFRKREAH